jgi:arylformamidase
MTPIDLSHTIEHGMITYRGLPSPLICDYLSREASLNLCAEGAEFHIRRIDMVVGGDSVFNRAQSAEERMKLAALRKETPFSILSHTKTK